MIKEDDNPGASRHNRSRDTIKTGSRHPVVKREKSRSRKSAERGKLLKDRKPSRECHEYDTPFDKSGRCHYHVNVQLASKKFTGGWHILLQVCPKCMEQKTMTKKKSSKGREENTLTVYSSARSSRGMGRGDALGQQHDDNGCCIVHSHVQVATKKLLGGGWKVRRAQITRSISSDFHSLLMK